MHYYVVQKHQHINVQRADADLQHNMRIANITTRRTQAALATIVHKCTCHKIMTACHHSSYEGQLQ